MRTRNWDAHLQDLVISYTVEPQRTGIIIKNMDGLRALLVVQQQYALVRHRDASEELEFVLRVSYQRLLFDTRAVKHTFNCPIVVCSSNRLSDRVSGETTKTWTVLDMPSVSASLSRRGMLLLQRKRLLALVAVHAWYRD